MLADTKKCLFTSFSLRIVLIMNCIYDIQS